MNAGGGDQDPVYCGVVAAVPGGTVLLDPFAGVVRPDRRLRVCVVEVVVPVPVIDDPVDPIGIDPVAPVVSVEVPVPEFIVPVPEFMVPVPELMLPVPLGVPMPVPVPLPLPVPDDGDPALPPPGDDPLDIWAPAAVAIKVAAARESAIFIVFLLNYGRNQRGGGLVVGVKGATPAVVGVPGIPLTPGVTAPPGARVPTRPSPIVPADVSPTGGMIPVAGCGSAGLTGEPSVVG